MSSRPSNWTRNGIGVGQHVEADVIFHLDRLVEIEQPEDPVEIVRLHVDLQFLAELVLEDRLPVIGAAAQRPGLRERKAEIGRHVEVVEEDRLEIAVAGERPQGEHIAGVEVMMPVSAHCSRSLIGSKLVRRLRGLVGERRALALAERAEAVIGRDRVGQHARERDLAELDRERAVVLACDIRRSAGWTDCPTAGIRGARGSRTDGHCRCRCR